MKQYDVIVAGGGMIGAAAALGLAEQGKRVVMLERQAPQAFSPEQDLDLRVSAFSQASVNFLQELQAWPLVERMRCVPYTQLMTWEDPEHSLVFDAEQLALDQLGFMAENRLVQLALWQRCEQAGVDIVLGQGRLLRNDGEQVLLEVGEQDYQASLLVVAEGANSSLREQLGIGLSAYDYRQHCFAVNVKLDAPQQHATWQQFCPSGPRALLPLAERHAALIWYDHPATIRRLKALSAAQLKTELLEAFPPLPGDIEVLASASFPLTRRHAHRYVKQRAVLIGDSAHTINPLAGQGVNLGYRDVAKLLECLASNDLDENLPSALQNWQFWRKPDNHLMQGAMDAFHFAFSNQIAPLKLLRGLGLRAAQRSGKLKDWALCYALGISPR